MASRTAHMHPSTTSNTTSIPTRCHYTMQCYICTHKTWLKTPRITHIRPCAHHSLPPSKSRARCTNMAPSPRSVDVPKLCPKCGPKDERGKDEEECEVVERGRSWHLESDTELESAMKRLTLAADKKDAVKPYVTAAKEKENKVASDANIGAKLGVLEAVKDKLWYVDLLVASLHSVWNGAPEKGKLSVFERVGRAFLPGYAKGECGVDVAKAYGGEDGKGKGEEGKVWVDVEADPDWAVVDEEERKEARRERKREGRGGVDRAGMGKSNGL